MDFGCFICQGNIFKLDIAKLQAENDAHNFLEIRGFFSPNESHERASCGAMAR